MYVCVARVCYGSGGESFQYLLHLVAILMNTNQPALEAQKIVLVYRSAIHLFYF